MRQNEKARSTTATVKRAEAAALGGSAASFYGEFTTTTPARQVADFLPHGAPIIIKCTETHMSRLCIFFLYRHQKTEVRPTGKYRYLTFEDRKKIEAWHLIGDRPADIAPLRPLHHDLQGAPARRDRRAGRKPARGVQRRAGREAAP